MAESVQPIGVLVQVTFRSPGWWRRRAGAALTSTGGVRRFWLLIRPDAPMPSGFALVDIKVLLSGAYERTFNDLHVPSAVAAGERLTIGPLEMWLTSAGPHWLELHIETPDHAPIETRQLVHEGEEGRGWWQDNRRHYLRTPIEVRDWATAKQLTQNRIIIALTSVAVILGLIQVLFSPAYGAIASALARLLLR